MIIVVVLSLGAAITGLLAILTLVPGITVQMDSLVFAGGTQVLTVGARDDAFYVEALLPGGIWPKGINRRGKAGAFAVFVHSPRRNGGLSLGFSTPWWALSLLLVCYPAWVYLYTRRQRLVERRRECNECINCGYSREGNTSGTCPECGKSLGALHSVSS